MNLCLIFVAILVVDTSANHPKHHHHHNHHPPPPLPVTSFVSSYSYSLPGNSYVSFTRTFPGVPARTPPRVQVVPEEGRSFPSSVPQLNQHVVHQPEKAEPVKPVDEKFNPFNPRFAIPKIEASDDEWSELLGEVFQESGLLDPNGGRVLRSVPSGLVNLNYDIHTCVHMGTKLVAQESAYPPTGLTYPNDDIDNTNVNPKLYTILMIDADLDNRLHWLVINVPGSKVNRGQTIASYAGPNPALGTGSHRYVILVMEQPDRISADQVGDHKSTSSCDHKGRDNFDLHGFRNKLNLSEPVAANYFVEEYNGFVESINSHCLNQVPINTNPLDR